MCRATKAWGCSWSKTGGHDMGLQGWAGRGGIVWGCVPSGGWWVWVRDVGERERGLSVCSLQVTAALPVR